MPWAGLEDKSGNNSLGLWTKIKDLAASGEGYKQCERAEREESEEMG